MITIDHLRSVMKALQKPVEYKPLLYFSPDGKIYDAGRNFTLVGMRNEMSVEDIARLNGA